MTKLLRGLIHLVLFAGILFSSVSEVNAATITADGVDSTPYSMTESTACHTGECLKGSRATTPGLFQVGKDVIKSVMNFFSTNPISNLLNNIAASVKKTWSSGYCWRAVKSFLVKAKLVGEGELKSPFARMAGQELEKKGFINLMGRGQPLESLKDPCLAPAGAILVYEGGSAKKYSHQRGGYYYPCGKQACGHTEMKVDDSKSGGQSSFASDYKSSKPVTGGCYASGNGYKLKAILIAPQVGI